MKTQRFGSKITLRKMNHQRRHPPADTNKTCASLYAKRWTALLNPPAHTCHHSNFGNPLWQTLDGLRRPPCAISTMIKFCPSLLCQTLDGLRIISFCRFRNRATLLRGLVTCSRILATPLWNRWTGFVYPPADPTPLRLLCQGE